MTESEFVLSTRQGHSTALRSIEHLSNQDTPCRMMLKHISIHRVYKIHILTTIYEYKNQIRIHIIHIIIVKIVYSKITSHLLFRLVGDAPFHIVNIHIR